AGRLSWPSAARPRLRRTWPRSRWNIATWSPVGASARKGRSPMFTFETSVSETLLFGRRAVIVAAGALLACAGAASAADRPHLGQPISPADAAAWDISIGPDGVGLPPGSGTPAQGAVVYAQKCAACHGDKGEGKTNARLVGGQITGPGPAVKTVG